MTVAAVPWCIQSGSHSAQLFRQSLGTLLNPAGGVVESKGLEVTEHSAANMTVNVAGGVPAGQIWVPGTSSAKVQSNYMGWNESTTNLAIAASSEANNRVDTIVAQIKDAAYAGAENLFTLSVIPGTAEGGVTKENKKGAGAVPASSLVIAYVFVEAKVAAIKGSAIENVASQIGLQMPGLVFKTRSASYEAKSGEFAFQEKEGTTTTLPAVGTANQIIGVWSGASNSIKITTSGGAKIYGDFINAATTIELTTYQHVVLQSNGTYWLIIAGEPKREQTYTEKTYSKAEAEAGVEPSATRPAMVSLFSAAGTAGNFTVGGHAAVSASVYATLFVPPGQKWIVNREVITGTILL